MSNFIFDIDGTLRNFEPEANIDPNLLPTLLEIKKNNKLYIVTGRTLKNVNNFLDELLMTKYHRDCLFEAIICEEGHICYFKNESTVLINKNESLQLDKVRKFVNMWITDNNDRRFNISPIHEDLSGEITITIQESNGNNSFISEIDRFIVENKLDRLKTNNLTHNRLSVSVIGIGKCSAIENSKLNLADSLFFCDEKNDLDLANKIIAREGSVICPSNAISELKDIATYVSDKPYSYGVVDYLSKCFKKSAN